MKLKKMTIDEINNFAHIYKDKSKKWDERMNELCNLTSKSERTVRKWAIKLKLNEKQPIISEQYQLAKIRDVDNNKKRYIITWAQNNTSPHLQFFNNIKVYANFINAEIIVIPGRYSNRMETLKKDTTESWHDVFIPYLTAKRINLNNKLTVLADIKVNATAVNPLTSLENLTDGSSAIVGHPRVHLKTLPVYDVINNPRMLFSTGTCTKPNFTDSKIGAIGSFHSTYGFVIVELDKDDIFYIRQVTANENGNFIDLFYEVKNNKVSKIDEIDAIIMGDIHLGETNLKAMRSTINLMNKLKPKNTILHDVFNGLSISHWDINNPIKLYHKEIDGTNDLKKEIQQMLDWLESMKQYNLVVVKSNHDTFIDRYIINRDWKKDIKNSVEYMEYAKILLERKAPKGLIPYIIDKHFKGVIKTLNVDESFKIHGFNCGSHGDHGVSGSRGSLNQFRKMNTKTIVGHYHVANRLDGALSVGTLSNLKLSYTSGPSTWSHTNVIIHKNGKAQHIIIMKDKNNNYGYTTFKK